MSTTNTYLDYINEKIDIAPANSQEELDASELLSDLMREHNLEVERQDFEAPLFGTQLKHILVILMFVGMILVGILGTPAEFIGILLVFVPLVVFVLQMSGRINLARVGAPAHSQNVIGVHRATGPLVMKGNRPIVIVAHYDTPNENILYKEPLVKYQVPLKRAQTLSILVPAICAFIQLLGFIPAVARHVFWIAGIICALPALLVAIAGLAERFGGATEGASDNKASVAALLSVMDKVRPSEDEAKRASSVKSLREGMSKPTFAEQAAEAEAANTVNEASAAINTVGSGEGDTNATAIDTDNPDAGDTNAPEINADELASSMTESGEDGAKIAESAANSDELPLVAPFVATSAKVKTISNEPQDVEVEPGFTDVEAEPGSTDVEADATSHEVGELTQELLALAGDANAADSKKDAQAVGYIQQLNLPNLASFEYHFENVRRGPEFIKSLGMVPAACSITYEEPPVPSLADLDIHIDDLIAQAKPQHVINTQENPYIDEEAPTTGAKAMISSFLNGEGLSAHPTATPQEKTYDKDGLLHYVTYEEQYPLAEYEVIEEHSIKPALLGDKGATEAASEDTSPEAPKDELGIQDNQDELAGTDVRDALASLDLRDAQDKEDALAAGSKAASSELEATSAAAPHQKADAASLASQLPLIGEEPQQTTAMPVNAQVIDASNQDIFAKTVVSTAGVDAPAGASPEALGDKAAQAVDPNWGKSTYAPTGANLARRAVLFDLPDPSKEVQDPFAFTDDSMTSSFMNDTRFDIHPAQDAGTGVQMDARAGAGAQGAQFAQGAQPIQEPISVVSAAPQEQNPGETGRVLPFKRKESSQKLVSEWLGVEEDFDASNEGRSIGGWQNFTHDERDGNGSSADIQNNASPDSGTGKEPLSNKPHWKGGAAYTPQDTNEQGEPGTDALDTDIHNTDAQNRVAQNTEAQYQQDTSDETLNDAYQEDLQELQSAILSMGDDELIAHDIWFVATGASSLEHAGMQAFLKEHRRDVRGAFVINLDSIGAGTLSVLTHEGQNAGRRADRRMGRMLLGIAKDLHATLNPAKHDFDDTDATVAMRQSMRATTLMGLNQYELPALSHTQEDITENVNVHQVTLATELVAELIRRS